jgi:ABC-type spermidine/putrescine transport system permease subunit II
MIRRVGQRIRRMSAVNWLLASWSAIVFVFLFAPIVTAVLYSFNQGILGRQTSDFTGFTTQWYSAAWSNGALRHSITISFKVAICTAALAGVLGTITGFVLARHRGRVVRVTLEVLVYLLLIVPEIVLAVALLVFYTKVGMNLGLWTLIAAHSPFTIAVVALIVRARVVSIDRSTEEAAADLGANRRQTFWDVTLPQVRLAVLAGMLLAFTFSFDDLVISLFLSTPTVTTLPVYLFGSVQLGVRPDVYAIATLMLAFTLLLLAASAVVYRWQRRQEGSRTSLLPGMAGGALAQTALGETGSA